VCEISVCEQNEKGKGIVQRKISSGSGLVFNGTGFYLTDYVHNKEKSAPSKPTTKTSTDTSTSATPNPSSTPTDSKSSTK